MMAVCSAGEPAQLQPNRRALLEALAPNLAHKQWKLRLKALQAADALACQVCEPRFKGLHASKLQISLHTTSRY